MSSEPKDKMVEDTREDSPEDSSGCCCYFPRRYIVTILLFLGMLIAHAQRVNVAVTVVTILDKTAYEKVGSVEAMASIPDVDWDSQMVGFLHAVFYIGYLVTQLPGGYLCTVLPSHRMFGGCIVLSCSLNLMLPVAIGKVGYALTCTIRLLQGLCEGVLYPSCYAVMRHWTTPEEKSRVGSLVLTGAYLGPVIGLSVSGAVTHYYGWNYVYYIHGSLGLVWFLFWLFLSYERPAYHPHISEEELHYIEKRQGLSCIKYKDDKVPWKNIFLSLPVNALNVCNFARSFVFFMLLTNEPAYVNVFGFTLAENGIFSALPHALMAITALFSGPLADWLIADPMFTTTQVRKMFTCLGFGMEAVCLYCLGFISDGMTAIVFLTIGIGSSGATISGWQINHLDLAPRYASVLVAITTAVGTVAGIVNPIIVGVLTKDQSMADWQHVFILTASVIMFAVIFYAIFGSGELQPWAEPKGHLQIVDKTNPFDRKPYGTFVAQVEHDGKPPPVGESSDANFKDTGNGDALAGNGNMTYQKLKNEDENEESLPDQSGLSTSDGLSKD